MAMAPCTRCGDTGQPWDTISGKSVCPECMTAHCKELPAEWLAGARVDARCCLCATPGAIPFSTSPLHGRPVLDLDFCATHMQVLLSRSLLPAQWRLLRRLLVQRGLQPRHVFLLHETFYDERGNALEAVP